VKKETIAGFSGFTKVHFSCKVQPFVGKKSSRK
jgi:hypothetical protein